MLLAKRYGPAKAKAKTCKTFNKFRGQVMNGDMIVHLRDQVIGLSPPDIEKLLGSPDFREGSSLSIGGKSGQDNWLYIVGSKPTLFRIMFKLGHCNETSALDYDEDPTYAEWYNDRMGRATRTLCSWKNCTATCRGLRLTKPEIRQK